MPYVDVGTHRLWVEERGAGPPVLFVHGLFLDGRVFEAQVEALSERYRTLAVDVRDHGRSEGPPRSWTLERAAREILAVVDELDHGPVHWIGLSMGGMIGLRAALAEPERVLSLALLDTSAGAEPRAWLHKTMARLAGSLGRPAMWLLMPYVVRQMFSPEGRGSRRAEVWRERMLGMDPAAAERAAMAVFDRGSVVDRLPEIEVPALVLVGEEDRAIPRSHAEAMADGLPDARMVEVPEAGHLTPLERPEAVTEEVDGLLRRTLAHAAEAEP